MGEMLTEKNKNNEPLNISNCLFFYFKTVST